MKGIFTSPTKGELTIGEVVSEIVGFIGDDPDVGYTLVIGTDSQVRRENGVQEVDFVTAIVIHREGKGGRYFWQKERKGHINSLRQKIMTETFHSLELAQSFVPILNDNLVAPYNLEIHIDVGEVGPTREMIKEGVGMVTGNGFVAKTKPESYGASTVADKYT